MNVLKLKHMLELFFIEDIGDTDVTSDFIFRESEKDELYFVAKEAGIFCGKDILEVGFRVLDDSIEVTTFKSDGDIVKPFDTIAVARGQVATLLKGERVILNLLQRLSGIATMTKKAVELTVHTGVIITDTRKTTPGLRMLEKYAVRCGGGKNHRNSLDDAIMIKDNHIAYAGSITEAVNRVKKKAGHTLKIEVEVETKEMMEEAIAAGVDIIMFDNCSPQMLREWLPLVPKSILTEASGGIHLENVREYAETGIDVLSLGCLTHSVKALDISAKVFK
jgi:nicotinate-nucleotide pyrophosphorylase (carboxylating)